MCILCVAIDRSDLKEVLLHAGAMRGKTVEWVNRMSGSPPIGDNKGGKGKVGHVVEEYFSAKMGSKSLPDLPELGIEIKSSPLKSNGNKIKEALTLNNFDLCREISACSGTGEHEKCNDITNASFYDKAKKILFVFYVHEDDKDWREWEIRCVKLWKMDKDVLEELRPDYAQIVSKLRNKEGLYCKEVNEKKKCVNPRNCKTNLHEVQNKFLTTCPHHEGGFWKAKTSKNSRIQPFGTERVQIMAFRLKANYIQRLFDQEMIKDSH